MIELPPNQQLAAPGKWPLVGEKEPRQDTAPWTVTVSGLVSQPITLSLEQLNTLPQVERHVDIHCVTRWSRLGTCFGGILLSDLLALAGPLPDARFISFIARSERNHSTSLALTDALNLETLVVLRYQGEPLPTLHGGPVRTVVPNRYFYKSLKWLERIELLAEDRLGYWESDAGYHNNAEPWLEERYIAPNIARQVLEKALRQQNFDGLDLRGFQGRLRVLPGLSARATKLRDAHFESAELPGADFTAANLSNAHLEGAHLRNARFVAADVEGADFSGADLTGADFSGASLFGATFCKGQAEDGTFLNGAKIDATTRFSPEQCEALAPLQQDYLASVGVRSE
jgi:hypothetical protein